MPKFALHTQIILGSVLGIIAGLLCNDFAFEHRGWIGFLFELNRFIGDIFIRGLRFVAVPIVFFSIVAGVGSLSDTAKLGRIAFRTILFYIGTTAAAISIGLLLANWIQPGAFVPTEIQLQIMEQSSDIASKKLEQAIQPDVWSTLLNIVPKNPFAALANAEMLQVLFFAVMIGLGLTTVPQQRSVPILAFFETMTDVMISIVHWIMRIAPLAVFALLFRVVEDLGLEVLEALLVYSGVVLLGLALLLFAVYPLLLWWLTGRSPRSFFRALAPAQLLAFSSSSSSATMPVTLDCVENNLELDREVSRFVIPMGATINMDGTALYQGVAALFIAQLYGLDLNLYQQATIVFTATLASIGTAGVPGVGLIMLVVVLQSIGLSVEEMTQGLAIIFGVDRLLDMSRTVINVTGDCTVASILSHWEKRAENGS